MEKTAASFFPATPDAFTPLGQGVYGCSIAEPSGRRVHPYRLSVAERGPFDLCAFAVERLDARRQTIYRVRRDRTERWSCSCQDAKYGAPVRRDDCKHVRACLALLGFLEGNDVAKTKTTPAESDAPPPAAAETQIEQQQQPRQRAAAPFPVPGVYAATARVKKAMSQEGIGKDRSNQQQGYKFRGIDDVYNHLSPHLAEAGLCIYPRTLSRAVSERPTQKGGVLFCVVVEVEYKFVCAADGSSEVVGPFFGEAMDSADKATNKGYSAAYKNMAVMTFCIPTEGTPDADEHTPEPAPAPARQQPPPAAAARNGAASSQTVWQQALSYEAKLVAKGLCAEGELADHLADTLSFQWGTDVETWPAEALADVKRECLEFQKTRSAQKR